ncbi:hypothetical protein FB451DRAFT_263467 [Mycena latifolia]|nr:hypothetical protein FB451DRAFT_263467 [Mycena latifolia]
MVPIEDGQLACTEVEKTVMPILRNILSEEVVHTVESTLEFWQIQTLVKDTTIDAVAHILRKYVICCPLTPGDSTTGSFQGNQDSTGEGSGEYGGPSRDEESIGEDGTGDGSGDAGQDNEPKETEMFRKASIRIIPTTFTSPRREHPDILNNAGSRIIRKAACKFAAEFSRTSTLPGPYDHQLLPAPVTQVAFFHATRSSHLQSFFSNGISADILNKRNELSHTSAFYMCNDVANAVAHVLHYHHKPLQQTDGVSVLSFVCDPKVLLGQTPTTNGYRFRTKIITIPPRDQIGHQDRYRDFCAFVRKNWNQSLNVEEKKVADTFDFIVAPVCESPSAFDVGVAKKLTENGPDLLQIAARTLRARLWLNSHIVEIAQE